MERMKLLQTSSFDWSKHFAGHTGFYKVCEETCYTLLHGQLQEGLKYSIMSAPAVSGAQLYAELCMAAKNEECRQGELAKRQQYQFRGVQSDGRERDSTVTSHTSLLTPHLMHKSKGGVTSTMELTIWPNFLEYINQRVKEVFPWNKRKLLVPRKL